jgi:hypothetical protein
LFIRPAANKYELASCDFWAENDGRTQPQLLSQWLYLIWRIRGSDLVPSRALAATTRLTGLVSYQSTYLGAEL